MSPRSQQVVIGKLEFQHEQAPPFVCIEPAQFPSKESNPATAPTRVECSHGQTPPMTSQADHMAARSPNTRAYVMLANFSEQTLTVTTSTVLVIEEEVSEQLIDKINQGKELNSDSPLKPQRKK